MNLTVKQVAAFEKFITELMEERNIPGLAVGIASGDKTIYKKGFGVKDLITKAPVTTKTIFGVASVTKSFTGTAIMKLCEDGKMSLDDPVKKFLPNFGTPNNSSNFITPHHCLTHTAGFPPLPSLGWGIRDNTRVEPKNDIVKKNKTESPKGKVEKARPPVTTYAQLLNYLRTGDFTMLGEPGKYFSYSNDAYGVLGAIIEKASGEMYARYLEHNILAPLGMKRSTFNLEEILKDDDTTTLYFRRPFGSVDEDDDEILSSNNWQIAPAHMACGWLKSCIDDLLNYVKWHASGGNLVNSKLLSKDSLDMMVHPYISRSRDKKYGYGFQIQNDYHGVTIIDHGGSLRGVSSQIGWIKEENLSAVVLCNLSGAPSSRILAAAFNMALGLPLDTPRSEYRKDDWSEQELKNLTGTFKSGEGGQTTLTSENGKLIARYGKDGKITREVKRDRENVGVVTIKGFDNEILFFRKPDGKVWAIMSGGRLIRESQAM